MEIRKLQRTGGASLTLTLPKKWTERFGLKEKDSVRLHMQKSGTLTVEPRDMRDKSPISRIHIGSLSDEMLLREVIAHYVSGVDEIHIEAPEITGHQRNTIRNIAKTLVGFEIVDEAGNVVVLKNILDVSKFPVPQNVEKIFAATFSMVEDALKAIADGDKRLAGDVIERDAEIDKWQLAITRRTYSLMYNHLTEEEAGLALHELHYYERVAIQLERIADHAVKIVRVVEASNQKPQHILTPSDFKKETNLILDLLTDTKRMVDSLDKDLAHAILNRTADNKGPEYLVGLIQQKKDSAVILIEDSIDRWMGYIMNIAERTIDEIIALENYTETTSEK